MIVPTTTLSLRGTPLPVFPPLPLLRNSAQPNLPAAFGDVIPFRDVGKIKYTVKRIKKR